MTTETSIFTTLYGPKFMDKLTNRDAHLVSCLQQDLANMSSEALGVEISTWKSINPVAGSHLTISMSPKDTDESVENIKLHFFPLTSQMLIEEKDSTTSEYITTSSTRDSYGFDTNINTIKVKIEVACLKF